MITVTFMLVTQSGVRYKVTEVKVKVGKPSFETKEFPESTLPLSLQMQLKKGGLCVEPHVCFLTRRKAVEKKCSRMFFIQISVCDCQRRRICTRAHRFFHTQPV